MEWTGPEGVLRTLSTGIGIGKNKQMLENSCTYERLLNR